MTTICHLLLIKLIFLIIHQSSSQPSPNHKNIQLIGNTRYVSLAEESQRDFCGNFWCTNDAFYLFTKSSQYVGVDPCVDFKNFTVNHVEEVDHPDDRHLYRGFQTIAGLKYMERLRKVLAAKIDPIKDSRVVKVMKNSFQKCLKSPHLTRHLQAHRDMIKHLQSLGGSPYLSKHTNFNLNLFNDEAVEYFYTKNATHYFTLNLNENVSDALWNENDFDLKKLFENEPWFALNLFLDLGVKKCLDDDEREVLCLTQPEHIEKFGYIDNEKYDFEVYKELFNELDDAYRHPKVNKNFIIEKLVKPTVSKKREYSKKREEIQNLYFRKLKFLLFIGRNEEFLKFAKTKISIKDLREKLAPDFDIDWLKIINSQLLEHSKVTENEEILIGKGGIELLRELVRNMIKTDKKILADTFVSKFLYAHRNALILRFHNQQQLVEGIKHGNQRWTKCIIQYYHILMYPAHIFMYEQWRPLWDRTVGDFNRDLIDERVDIVGSAEKFVREAVDEFKLKFKTQTNLKPSIAIDVLNKLNSLKIVVSLQSNIFTAENLEEFYSELQLNGDEEFLESIFEMQKNHRKILNERRNSWQRQIDRMVYAQEVDLITYKIEEGNILYIPPLQIMYPYYHPLRPRFFNMATIFKDVLIEMNVGVKEYVRKKFNFRYSDFTTETEEYIKIAYEHYSNWLRNHTDLIIGANLLTHRQLYWVALAVSSYIRLQKDITQSFYPRIQSQQKYFHVWFKQFKGFQEAFQCNITAEEIKQYQKFH